MPLPPASSLSSKFCIESGFYGNLSDAARELASASVALATRRAYQAAIRRLSSWLNGRQLTDKTQAKYLAHLHESGNSPATCAQVVAAIQFAGKVAGCQTPFGPLTQRVLAGIRRAGRERGRGQAQGITWEEANRMAKIAAARQKRVAGLRDAAIIATASDALLRVGELSALMVDDFAEWENGSGRLAIRFSKTDQHGDGAILYLGAMTVKRLQAWIDLSAVVDGPLFRQVRQNGVVLKDGISPHSMRAIIQRCAIDAGIRGAVRGHSLRVGASQSLAGAGAGLVELQTVGRWKSPLMPARYARAEIAGRSAVARYRYKA